MRQLNLPSTPRWRNWLRTKLPSKEMGVGKVYDSSAVDALSPEVGDFAKDTAPVDELKNLPVPTSRELDEILKLNDRRGPSA